MQPISSPSPKSWWSHLLTNIDAGTPSKNPRLRSLEKEFSPEKRKSRAAEAGPSKRTKTDAGLGDIPEEVGETASNAPPETGGAIVDGPTQHFVNTVLGSYGRRAQPQPADTNQERGDRADDGSKKSEGGDEGSQGRANGKVSIL